MNKSQTFNNSPHGWGPVTLIAGLLLLFRLIPLLFPDARLWGLNHLLFLPDMFTGIYIIGALLAILVFLPPACAFGQKPFDAMASFLMENRSYRRWLFISLLILPLLWLARMPTNLLGDGYSVINNIGNDLPVMFKWSEVGVIKVIYAISYLIPKSGLERGVYTYASISVMSGAIVLFLMICLAYELGRDKAERFFILCLMTISGWGLLFFGYAENYPLIWPFVIAYIYFSVRYLGGRGSLVAPTIFLAAALVLHLQIGFFLISYAALITGRSTGKGFYDEHRGMVRVFVAIVVTFGIAAFFYLYNNSLPFKVHFLPPFVGRPATPDYFIFSPKHLFDIFNEICLLIPLWLALIYLSRGNFRSLVGDKINRFLLLFTFGGILFILVVDPKLGMGRDWDLFALTGIGPALLLGRLVVHSDKARRFLPALILTTLVLIFPFFAANLSYQSSINYMKWLLKKDLPKSKPGMVMLRGYYYDIGDTLSAENINQQIWDTYPSARLAPQITELSKAGRHQKAMALADSIYNADPYSREGYSMRGAVYLRMGEYEQAVENLKMAIRLEPYDHRTYVNLARAYYRTGEHEHMMKNLRHAQKLNPDGVFFLQAMALAFIAREEFDSTIVYSMRLIEVDPTVPNAYIAAGEAYYRTGQYDKAKPMLKRFIEIAPPGPDRDWAEEILKKL
jgi:tetratricopeptide (TPR) repeat protein